MSAVTTVVIQDPELLAKLATASGPILFRGPNGEYVRFAEPVPPGQLPAGMKSPVSDEEFEQARKQTGGRPLADILKDLRQKYGDK